MKMQESHLFTRFARHAIICAALLLAVSCGGRKKAAPAVEQERSFPTISVPTAYTEPAERIEYLINHYWDEYFAGSGRTDSARIIGVPKARVEQALANYIAVLNEAPLPQAQKSVAHLFDQIAAKQVADTSQRVYLAMTETVARYLYDPNSPLRDEDLYLPFVQKMAESPLTKEEMRTAYRYEAQMCALNHRGSIAPDFIITLRGGIQVRMHSIKADRLILFFSNPGCQNCKEIIDALKSDKIVQEMVSYGQLAIANVYIDEDLKAWRDYMPIYPKEWLNGYDAAHILREDQIYCIRAIPSLYLLDADKRILLKDAPLDRLLKAL
ncbi:MAG: DUF5106 domain-containing protein [Bacteroidales bacterium]|nr:DUF5106 domain-containing protein [Bacteroidales bacterium]